MPLQRRGRTRSVGPPHRRVRPRPTRPPGPLLERNIRSTGAPPPGGHGRDKPDDCPRAGRARGLRRPGPWLPPRPVPVVGPQGHNCLRGQPATSDRCRQERGSGGGALVVRVRRAVTAATPTAAPVTMRQIPAQAPPPSPMRSSRRKLSMAPGRCPATWAGQLPGGERRAAHRGLVVRGHRQRARPDRRSPAIWTGAPNQDFGAVACRPIRDHVSPRRMSGRPASRALCRRPAAMLLFQARRRALAARLRQVAMAPGAEPVAAGKLPRRSSCLGRGPGLRSSNGCASAERARRVWLVPQLGW